MHHWRLVPANGSQHNIHIPADTVGTPSALTALFRAHLRFGPTQCSAAQRSAAQRSAGRRYARRRDVFEELGVLVGRDVPRVLRPAQCALRIALR
jgi:hypothetical protein